MPAALPALGTGPHHSPRLASPSAPEVDELEGQRAGQQQVGQRLPGPRLAEAGPGPGVPPARFLQGCKRSGSVPTSSSPPCSPPRAPTPPAERETDQVPMGASRGQALSWCSSPSEKRAGCAPVTEEETEVQSGEGTCQRPSLGSGRARMDPSPARLSGKSAAAAQEGAGAHNSSQQCY